MLKVVVRNERYLDEISRKNGYVMVGCKGKFISARTPDNKFIWVRLNPPKTTKPVNEYDTLTDAIRDKISKGYDVYEYTSEHELKELLK